MHSLAVEITFLPYRSIILLNLKDPRMSISFDNLIIGSGAAGSSLAKVLNESGYSYLVIEIAGSNEVDLNHDHMIDSLDETVASSVRTVKSVGGGTALWGGGLIEFSKDDFDTEHAFGSDRLFENLKKKYSMAWKFFGFVNISEFSANKKVDLCYVQKAPINLGLDIESKSILHGRIIALEKKGFAYRSLTLETLDKKHVQIYFKNLILANGTLGILKLVKEYQDTFFELPLNKILVGLFTHPKCSVKMKRIVVRDDTVSGARVDGFRLYKQLRFGVSSKPKHAVRFENKFLNLLEKILNSLKFFLKFSFVRKYVGRVFHKLYNGVETMSSRGFGVNLKIFIDSLEPNFNVSFCSVSHNPILKFSRNSIDLVELNKSISKLGVLDKRVTYNDITSVHTHFFGGLKLDFDGHSFISPSGKVTGSSNLWINGPILLNARGYANPVLSIVALSHVIAEDISNV